MPAKGKYLPYKDAIKLVGSLGLANKKEWSKYSKTDSRFQNVPTNPVRTYRNNGWVSWMDWLGTTNRRPWEREYNVNDNYFKRWSHNMSYILGFWFADGNIFVPQKRINFSQHRKDIHILEDIKKELCAENPVLTSGRYSRLNISSEIMLNDIMRLGGLERKSLTMIFPRIPRKYLSDFVRGLWDGDGCISYNKSKKTFHSNYVSGSKKFVVSLHDILRQNISGLEGCFRKNKKKAYRLQFSKNDTIRLRKFMYPEPLKDRIKLNRKYNLFSKTEDCCSRDFLNYEDAKKCIDGIGIKTTEGWKRYWKNNDRPYNIPARPDVVYKNKGWCGWKQWLETKVNMEKLI